MEVYLHPLGIFVLNEVDKCISLHRVRTDEESGMEQTAARIQFGLSKLLESAFIRMHSTQDFVLK